MQNLQIFLQASGVLSPAKAQIVAEQFVEKELKKHDYLLQHGHVSNEYYFIETGVMRAFAYDTEGNDITTGIYLPNQVVFDVASFFNRTASMENIQALTDCEGYYITFEKLNVLFHSMPEFREFGRSVLVKGYASLKARMLSTITETAEVRYAELLAKSPDIFQHVPLKYIATYLGITDSSLSRIRREFSKP